MRLVTSVFAVLLLGAGHTGAVNSGDSADSVREELGIPNGLIEIGPNRVLFYDRGEVVLRNEHVTEHNLMSKTQYAEQLRRDAERKELLSRLAQERRLLLEAEGIALKQTKLDDPTFVNLSPAARFTFWRTFQKKYPMVPVDLELSSALAEYESARLIAENRALALKVNQLEAQLYQAELDAYRSRRTFGWGGYWGIGFYGGGRYPGKPPYHPGHPHHPDRPDKGKSDHDFYSTKGSVMATMDRARGRYDSSYNASRNAIYARTKP